MDFFYLYVSIYGFNMCVIGKYIFYCFILGYFNRFSLNFDYFDIGASVFFYYCFIYLEVFLGFVNILEVFF